MAALPDKGERIKSQIGELTNQIASLDIQIKQRYEDLVKAQKVQSIQRQADLVKAHSQVQSTTTVSGCFLFTFQDLKHACNRLFI